LCGRVPCVTLSGFLFLGDRFPTAPAVGYVVTPLRDFQQRKFSPLRPVQARFKVNEMCCILPPLEIGLKIQQGDDSMKLKWDARKAVFVAVLLGAALSTGAQNTSMAVPPASIPTFSTEDVARTGFFYAGGKYVGTPGKEVMDGAEYVEVMVPKKIRHLYPIVIFHGAGQTGTDWLQTPDGRAGWTYYFLKQGYTVYMVDYPARGRSAYVPEVDGNLTIRTAPNLEQVFTDIGAQGNWPQAKKFTQWPGEGPNKGKMGDPIFDRFAKTQVQFLSGGKQAQLNLDAHIALLDMIGTPVVLLTHSQGGEFGWQIADARPKLVKAIITAEPAGPPECESQLGRDLSPAPLRAARKRSIRTATRTRRKIRRARRGSLLSAERASPQIGQPQGHSRAGRFCGSELSPRVRFLHSEVAESGGSEDGVRENGRCRTDRQ
jgi:pimeloyl-ACP methyl ester carboxylesterase